MKLTKEEIKKLDEIKTAYDKGLDNLNKKLTVFNNRTILEEARVNQEIFNMVNNGGGVEDWQADTIRPITRNKIIQIATRLIEKIIYPSYIANNDDSDRDKEAEEIMDLLARWVVTHSNYEQTFIRTVMSALTDPIAYTRAGFYERMRGIRQKGGDMKYVVDEFMSGFVFDSLSVSSVLFDNLYEQDIQKQDWIIHRYISTVDKVKAQFNKYERVEEIQGGKTTQFDDKNDTLTFVDKEGLADNEVLVIHYYSRYTDEEHIVAGGLLLTELDNPMTREDKLYPFAKIVYEEIQDLFVGKSAVSKLAPDQDLIDGMWNMIFDSGIRLNNPSLVAYGTTSITGDILTPGQITMLDEDAKIENLFNNSNGFQAGLALVSKLEQDMAESSQSSRSAGIADSKEMTAVEFSGLEKNSITVLGLFGKQLGNLVKQLGMLIEGDIKQYLTLPKVDGIIDGVNSLKYKSVFVSNDITNPSSDNFSNIQFTDKFFGADGVDADKISVDLLQKEGLKGNSRIKLVDTILFRNTKFLVYISPEMFNNKNERLERAMKLEVYDRAIGNPVIDKEKITEELLLKPVLKSASSDYIMQQQAVPQPQEVPSGGELGPTANDGNLVRQITGSNSLKNLLS